MSAPSRRSFLLAAGAGAAGLAGAAATSTPANAARPAAAPALAPALHTVGQEEVKGVLVRITDVKTGRLGVLVGEREIPLTDPAMVAAVLKAAGIR